MYLESYLDTRNFFLHYINDIIINKISSIDCIIYFLNISNHAIKNIAEFIQNI